MNRSPPTPPTGWHLAVPWIVAAYVVQTLEVLMATVTDLVAQYPHLHDELTKLETDVTSLIGLVKSLGTTPEQQAAIDSTLASMQSDTAAAAASDVEAQGTLNPTPAPTEAPPSA